MFCQPISLAKQNHPLGVLRSGRLRWRQASSPTSDGDATRRRRRRRRRAWRPSSSLQSEAEGRGDATKRGSFSRGGERGECCKDERDARWRFCLEDDRVSLPRHPPSRPPDLPPSRPPVRLIYRLCRARSKRSSVASASRPPSSLSLGAGSSAIDHGRGARRRRRARPPSFAALSPSLPPVTALFLAHTI